MASHRAPNEAWRDVVSTFWNTVDTIGVAVAFLPLPLVQLLELRCVDSRWNLAVRDSVKRLKCKEATKDVTLGALVNTFCEVRSLSLSGTTLTCDGFSHLSRLAGVTELDLSTSDNDDAVFDVLVRLPRLTALKLYFMRRVTNDGVAKLCAMPKLTSLDLRGCHRLASPVLERLGEALPKLTSLCIDDALAQSGATQHLQRFPRLTSLTAQGANDASVAHVRSLTGLAVLDVSHSERLTNVGLTSVCSGLPNLTSLSLRECGSISHIGVKSVSQLTALTLLDIVGCLCVGEPGFAAISRLAGLKTLRVDRLGVTHIHLAHVAKLVGLTELSLGECSKLGTGDLQCLAPLTHLRSLNLSACGLLTDAFTATLGSFEELRTLQLQQLKLSSVGLANIAKLPRLTELDLFWSGDGVTGDGVVAFLSKMRSLERLDLRLCRCVSADAVVSLRAAIPGVEVLR